MGTVCIIEQDAHVLQMLESTLKEVDSQLEILTFQDLGGFHQWFSQIMNSKNTSANGTADSTGPSTSATHQTPQASSKQQSVELKLLIGDIQFLGPNYFTLIEKLRKLMVRRNLLKSEEDLAILLTAFDSPDMDHKQIESRIITNIIFKPFDVPILKQQLKVALAGSKIANDSSVFLQKIESTAEMLKEVQLESFTDLGFITRSNRDLKINDVSKYYSKHFEAKGKLSILARCVSCVAHPHRPGEFQAEFRYYSANNNQVRQLRQTLFAAQHDEKPQLTIDSKKTIPRALKKDLNHSENTINFLVFLKSSTDPSIELKDAVENNLSNVSMVVNRNINLFLESTSKNETSHLGVKPIHGVIVNADTVLSGQGLATWTQVIAQIEAFNQSRFALGEKAKPKLILSSYNEVSEEKLRSCADLVSDIIYTPVDRPYLNKRLVTLFPEIQPRLEAIDILRVNTDEIIRVANPIAVTSISEAIITMKYYRPISFHSFRRFCLPSSREGEEKLELLGTCIYHEKKDNYFLNHFVFFGITDKYLKYIRLWILERYIAAKEAKSSGAKGGTSAA